MKTTKKKKKPKTDKLKAGRKQYWDRMNMKDKLESIRGWAMQGSTDEEIYTMLGISKDTFYKWKRERLEFAEALKRGKDIANGELLNSAFKQSTGHYVPTTIAVKVKKAIKNPDGSVYLLNGKPVLEEEVVLVPTEEYIPANPTMNIFMLKNRMPEEYKDKHEVEHSGGMKLEQFFTEE